jgi:hypothetical protein
MSGEASITAAASGMPQVLLQGIEIDLHYVYLSSRKCVDKVCSWHSCDFGASPLRDQAAPVPIDCSSEANVLRQLLR